MKRTTSMLACAVIVLPAVGAGVAAADLIESVRPAGSTFELQVTGVAGVPANTTAVVLNVTSAGASGAGFITAYPCGETRPTASNLNYGPGAPVANSAIVKVGTGGKVCLYNGDGATEMIVDINGWFATNSGYTSATPARIMDTRSAPSTIDGIGDGEGRRQAGSTYELQVTGRAGVPSNAAAVVLNLTSAGALGNGFLTAYPCGATRPTASNLNFRAGAAAANSSIVKVGTDGRVCLYIGDADTQLIADVNGWFAPNAGYTSATPARIMDTRSAPSTTDGIGDGEGLRQAGSTYELQVTGRAGVPSNASAVVLNLTSASARGTGFLTAWPCGQSRPNASNLNYGPGMAVANSAIVKVGGGGRVCLYTGDTDTQLIADVNGWFTSSSSYTPITPSRLLDTRDLPAPSSGAAFVETFTGNTGLERFRTGVFHRGVDAQGLPLGPSGQRTWQADHDIHLADCGDPNLFSHTADKAIRSSAFYVCRDHMMSTMGDVDAYSVAWFAPNQIFNGQTRVSWDVSVTDLKARKWWEVAIIPAGGPEATVVDWLSPDPSNLPEYPTGSVVVGNGPFGGSLLVHSNGQDRNPDWRTTCQIDPAGCASKAIRRTWSIVDNRNGTITVRFNENAYTVPGSFPPGDFEVIFKDHNYTPDKDGVPIGHTWHWDNIIID